MDKAWIKYTRSSFLSNKNNYIFTSIRHFLKLNLKKYLFSRKRETKINYEPLFGIN